MGIIMDVIKANAEQPRGAVRLEPADDPNAWTKPEPIDRPVTVSAYCAPHGEWPGIAGRIRRALNHFRYNKSTPWVGLGIVRDLEMLMKVLDLPEFVEWLRVNGDKLDLPGLDASETAEAIRAEIHRGEQYDELIEEIDETLDPGQVDKSWSQTLGKAKADRERLAAVRTVMEQLGVVDDQTPDDDLPGLLRALLA